MRPRRQHGPEHEEQKWQNSSSRQQAAGNMRQDEAAVKYQFLLVVVGPLAARGVCTSVCEECVCVVTNIVGQHTHTHTHPYTRTDTPRLCCNFFSFSLPCCCLPLPALVIIVFAFFSSFFLFLVNLLSARLPCCCCCWLSSLVRNVIKFLLVQQHSTLFSSPQFYCSCQSSSFAFHCLCCRFCCSSLAFGLRYLPRWLPLPRSLYQIEHKLRTTWNVYCS